MDSFLLGVRADFDHPQSESVDPEWSIPEMGQDSDGVEI